MPRSLTNSEVASFRSELCAAAERLFAEHGYAGVTLRALASEVGCSAMTPYRYFENKDAIFVAVRTEAFLRFGDVIERTASQHPDPIERVRAFGRAYFGFALEQPHAYRIMFELSQPAGLDQEIVEDPERFLRLKRGWQPLVDAIAEGVAARQLHGDPLTLAHVAWVGLHGLVTLELADKLILGRSLDELIEPVIENFLRGAGAPPAAFEGKLQ